MERHLSSQELRIAARQAITLALSMPEDGAREALIRRAERLTAEAEALEKARFPDQ